MTMLEVDPNLVRPGWAPLLVVALLGIVLFFLGRSMLKQFRKIDVPADHDPASSAVGATPGASHGGAAGEQRGAGELTVTEPGSGPAIPDLRARESDQPDGDPPPGRS